MCFFKDSNIVYSQLFPCDMSPVTPAMVQTYHKACHQKHKFFG